MLRARCAIIPTSTSCEPCQPTLANAAVGKSVDGRYVAYKAVRAGRPVAYVSDKSTHGLIIPPSGPVYTFMRRHFTDAAADLFLDPNAVVIFDGDGDGTGKPPFASAAAVVLVTSPKPERYKEFHREGAPVLTFPLFSLAEMHLLRETCFPAQRGAGAAAGMERRFKLWGGNPRAVLTHLML